MAEAIIKKEFELSGIGTVRDHRGQEVSVSYTLVVSSDVANSSGQRFAEGRFTRIGQANVDCNRDLTLVLADSRELRIVVTDIQNPMSPTRFVVRATKSL